MHEQQLEIIFENLPVEESLNRFIAEIMFDSKCLDYHCVIHHKIIEQVANP
jgi:hypothetical protein